MINRFDKPYRHINNLDNNKISELFTLINTMDSQELKQFSLIYKIPLSVKDIKGNSLIHKILENNDQTKNEITKLNLIKFLVQENVNPDTPNSENITPLHIACQKQYLHIIKYLLEIGCNPNYNDNINMTPLHYLLSGNIKLCQKKNNIKPLYQIKTSNTHKINTEKMIELKKHIWEKIKSEPLLDTVKDTLFQSIAFNPIIKSTLINFEERLNKIIFNTSLSKNDKILNMITLSKFSLEKDILNRWGKFSRLSNIEIHNKLITSWSPIPEHSSLSLIKNHDYNQQIIDEIEKSKDKLLKILSKDIIITDDIDLDIYGLNIFKSTILENIISKSNLLSFISPVKNNIVLIDETKQNKILKTINNKNFFLYNNKYIIINDDIIQEMNNYYDNYIHPLAIDYADNIIDWNNLTLAGGSRIIKINDEIPQLIYKEFLDLDLDEKLIFLIRRIKFDYLIDASNNKILKDNLVMKKQQANPIIKYIYNYIKNQHKEQKIESLKSIINPKILYLVMKKNTSNPISWLYTLINIIICDTKSQLEGTIRQCIMYLIAGFANKTTDLELSLIQAMKTRYLPRIVKNNGFINDSKTILSDNIKRGSIFASWIYYLLSDDKTSKINDEIMPSWGLVNKDTIINYINTKITDDKLKSLTILTFDYFSNNKISNIKKLKWIEPLVQNISNGELLSVGIVKYYNLMSQKPLMQHIVDIISLIRYFNIYENKSQPVEDKLKNLYIPCKDNIKIEDIELDSLNKLDKNLKIILPDEMDESNLIKIENLLKYQIPSKLNINLIENIEEDHVLKYIESYYLGLFYLGQLPEIKITNLEIKINNVKHTIDLNSLYILNYNNIPEQDNINSEYFNFYGKKMRAPLSISYFKLLRENINRNKLLQEIILEDSGPLKKIIRYLPKKSSNYSKILPYYYPILKTINMHELFYINIIKKELENNNEIKKDILNFLQNYEQDFDDKKFATEINIINAYSYMYHYLNTPGKYIQIPKFFYYEFPNNTLTSFLNFDNNIQRNVGETLQSVNNSNLTKNKDIQVVMGNYNHNLSGYKQFLNFINDGNYFVSTKSIKKTLKRNKKKRLPPALNSFLNIFYEFNIIKIIKEYLIKNDKTINDLTLEIIDKDLINIEQKNKQIQSKYIQAKIVEEIIRDYLLYQVKIASSKIYSQILSGKNIDIDIFNNKKLKLNPNDLSLKLNNIDIKNIKLKPKIQKILYNFYKPIQDLENKKEFVIYPNDYTNTTLIKSKYCLEINKEIISILIQNGANIRLKDNEQQSPIYSLLKNYYALPFKTLYNEGIDFRLLNINKINNKISPYDYIITEYKNHITKYIGENGIDNKYNLNYVNILDNFTNNQYKEIKLMVLSNEKFGNNLLRNLDISFLIVNYLIQQYLTVNLLRYEILETGEMTDIETIIETIYNLFGIKKEEIDNMIYDKKFNDLEIKNSDINIIGTDLLKIYETKIEELNNQKNRYKKNSKIINLSLKTQYIQNKTVKIVNEIKEYENNKKELKNFMNKNILSIHHKKLNETKIISKYDEILKNINNQRGNYINGWKKILNTKEIINENTELIPIKLLGKELELLQDNIDDNKLDKLKNIYLIYTHLFKISEDYYNNDKYLETNKQLNFIKDVLVHLTQNIICYNIEMILRRLLFSHIKSVNPNDTITEIINKIDYIFTLEHSFDNTKKNLKSILYNEISIKMVNNSVDIFNNNQDKISYEFQNVREILIDYFNLLKLDNLLDINISTPILLILKEDVASYFNAFTSKTINNWMVVIENQFKFIINEKRILETLLTLFGKI